MLTLQGMLRIILVGIKIKIYTKIKIVKVKIYTKNEEGKI